MVTYFIIAYHISLVKVQDNYCNNNLFIVDVKQLNKIIKLYYFHTLKVLWDGQSKIKMYYGMSKVKKQLSGKRSIINGNYLCPPFFKIDRAFYINFIFVLNNDYFYNISKIISKYSKNIF